MSSDEFYAHAMRASDPQGRLPLSRMTGWDIFPFEPDGLRVARQRDQDAALVAQAITRSYGGQPAPG